MRTRETPKTKNKGRGREPGRARTQVRTRTQAKDKLRHAETRVQLNDIPAADEQDVGDDLRELIEESPFDCDDEDDVPEERGNAEMDGTSKESVERMSPRLKLDAEGILLLRVRSNPPRCSFEPSPWFETRSARLRAGPQARQARVLRALAWWLEDAKRPFLEAPSPESFLQGDSPGPLDLPPAVSSLGVLMRLNARLRARGEVECSGGAFALLVPTVWLAWPALALPLSNLFTVDLRALWAATSCRNLLGGEAVQVVRSLDDDPTARNSKQLQGQSPENLDVEEKVVWLWRKSRCRWEDFASKVLNHEKEERPAAGR